MKQSNQNINLYSYQSSSSNSGHHLAISDNGQSSLNSQPQSQIISTSKQSLSDVGIQCDNSSFRYPYSLDSAKDEELSKVQKVIPGKQNNVSNNQSIKSQQQMVDIKTSLRNKASQLKTLKPSYQNFLDYLNEPSIHQIILSNESSIHQPTFFQDSIIDQTLTNHLILFYQAQIGKLKVENNKLAAQIHSLKNDNSRYLQLQYEINQYNATKTNSYNSIRSENDSTNSIGKLDINNIVSKYEKIYTKYRSNKAKTRQFSEIAKKFRETSSKFGDH